MTGNALPFKSDPSQRPRRVSPRSAAFAVIALAWGYLFVLTALVIRPVEQWQDLFSYILRFSIDPYSGMAIPQSILEYPLAEYGWQLLIRFFFNQGTDFETAFFLLSVLTVAAVAYVLLRRTRNPLALLIFLNPTMLDFFISQGRSALAFAIMLLFYFRRTPVAIAGIALAATVHTSMGLMLVPLAINLARRQTVGDRDGGATSHFWPIVAIGTGVSLTLSQVLLLDFLGDRRGAYAVDNLGAGALFTLGWTAVSAVFYLCNGSRSRLHGIAAIFFVALFVTSSILDLYSHRYIAYFLPFMALAICGSETLPSRRIIFFAIYAIFGIVYFSYWM